MREQLEEFKKAWLLFGGKKALIDLFEAIVSKLDDGLTEAQIDEIRKGITTPMDSTQFKQVLDADGNLQYIALHDDYKKLLDRLAQMEKDVNQLKEV